MEEDIKFIKYYMKQYFYEDISIEDDFKFEKAIKNLLTSYKELAIRNDELNKAIGKEYELGRAQGEYEVNEEWKHNIKEKIEEYKKNADIAQGEELLILDSKVDTLQELLD